MGATRQVPAMNGYPPNSGGRTRTRQGNPAFQGTGTGSTGYPVTRVPVYQDSILSRSRSSSGPHKRRTGRTSITYVPGITENRAHVDYTSLRDLCNTSKPRHYTLTQDFAFVVSLNQRCYFKFFLVGGSTLDHPSASSSQAATTTTTTTTTS